jgi:hypothetical protein
MSLTSLIEILYWLTIALLKVISKTFASSNEKAIKHKKLRK